MYERGLLIQDNPSKFFLKKKHLPVEYLLIKRYQTQRKFQWFYTTTNNPNHILIDNLIDE